MQPDRPNLPVPDELARIRDQIRALEERQDELRKLLLANPDLREGAAYLAEIKVTGQQRLDQKELRANYPDIAEQFTFPVAVTRIELSEISEDGEITRRKRRSA